MILDYYLILKYYVLKKWVKTKTKTNNNTCYILNSDSRILYIKFTIPYNVVCDMNWYEYYDPV